MADVAPSRTDSQTEGRPRMSPPAMPLLHLHPPRAAGVRYLVSLGGWLLALALTLSLESYVQRANFVFFWVAVLFAAWYGGLIPALLAAVASVVTVNYYFVPPLHELGLRSVADVLTLAIFVGASMTVASLTAALSRAQRRASRRAEELEALAAQLEAHAADLERQTDAAQEMAQELEQANEHLESLAADSEQSRRAAESAADRMGRLQRVTAALARAVTTSDVAGAVIGEGIAALGATDGVLYAADGDGGPLELVRSHGLPEETVRDFRRLSLAAATPMADAVRTREPVFLEDRSAVLARYPSVRASNARVRADAWAAMPLVAGERVAGGMAFGFDSTRRFSGEDRAFLTALAQQCAVALERARLYDAERAARGDAERARAAAEAANRAKSEFLATMSHELRTPLNAIGGYAELLEMGIHGPVTDAQRDALARVRRSQRVLLALINDVLNLARIEAGTVDFVLESVPLDEALEEVEALVAPQVAAKGLRYQYAERCAAGVRVRADRDKLRQIVLNLLSNAIKFTDRGGTVRLSCDASDDASDGASGDAAVRVRVHDSGRGIPETHHEAIFEPFVQVDASYTRTTDGTGLGLAISRDLARAMGAELTLESSRIGEGSTFTLALKRG